MMQFINKNNIFEKLQNLNKGLIFIVCLIFLCGLLILYSASGANIKPWVIRQFIYFCVFAPVAIIISITNIKTLFKMSYIIYFIGVFLLLLVEFHLVRLCRCSIQLPFLHHPVNQELLFLLYQSLMLYLTIL